jgi:transcriptional regulator with XRE-family HTH domain
MKLTGRLVTAARALAGVSRSEFAAAAGLSEERVASIEGKGSAWVKATSEVDALARAMAHFGVVAVEEGGGLGAGVRLKFTRHDVKQILRLEDEGGVSGADDNP